MNLIVWPFEMQLLLVEEESIKATFCHCKGYFTYSLIFFEKKKIIDIDGLVIFIEIHYVRMRTS